MIDLECYCDRCSGLGPTCEVGDHDWAANGRCRDCGDFNGGVLAHSAYEKAAREGRACEDHFHRTAETKAACATPWRDPPEEADHG